MASFKGTSLCFPCDTMHKSGLSPRQQGEGEGNQSQRHFLQARSQKLKNKYLGIMCPASQCFSPPSSHLATCACLIKVLPATHKSLVMMLCRYQPISEPARSMPLDAISQPDQGRRLLHVAFQPSSIHETDLNISLVEFIFEVGFPGYIHFISFNPLMLEVVVFFSLILLKCN